MEEGQDSNDKTHDFLISLKRAEPLAVLASISLVIAVFTFEHQDRFQAVYNYSVISAFMFLLSFVFAIITNPRYLKGFPFGSAKLISFGTYFFLAIGIIYLLMIAIEFGREHAQISLIVLGWGYSFVGGMIFLIAHMINIAYRRKTYPKRLISFKVSLGLFIVGGLGWIGLASSYLIESFTGSKIPIPEALYVYVLGAPGIAILILLSTGALAERHELKS